MHKEKTKEITTVTVVWIPILEVLRIFALNFSKNYEWFEKPYQKLERVFHHVSKHLEVGQKNSGKISAQPHTSLCMQFFV